VASYIPFDDRPFRLRMGLRPLDLAAWLEVDEHLADDLALKRQLVEERYDDVVAIVDDPAVHAAAAELWDFVLRDATPPWFAAVQNPEGGGDEGGLHPIVRCGLSTQEDWALMVPVDGELVLAAACICFPTRWVLSTKIGKPMAAVHEHVAYYDEHLSTTVDSFFGRITVDKPVWRLNWNLMDDPALYQPIGTSPPGVHPGITPDNAGERLWLRVERQTLRRLPETGAVAFGIRIHQRPVSALLDSPDDLATLRTAIANLPPETFDYKSLGGFSDALDAWIMSRLSLGTGALGGPTEEGRT
jgi:hypothetical protein